MNEENNKDDTFFCVLKFKTEDSFVKFCDEIRKTEQRDFGMVMQEAMRKSLKINRWVK